MALEITEDQATELGLSTDQVAKVIGFVNPWHDSQLAESKKGWDTKANTDAQGILDGAMTGIATATKIARNEGEKAMDYIPRAWGAFSKSETDSVAALKLDYETKLKDFDGDAGTKEALRVSEDKLNKALEKYAKFDELSETAGKYDPLKEKYESMKKLVSYGNVKPAFPDTVDEYRATAKWNEFISRIEKDWIVEVDKDGKSIAKSKENEYTIVDLSSLVEKDEEISKLLEGRKQDGLNGKEKDLQDVTDVPFKVPADADSIVISKLIKEYLASKNINPMTDDHTKQFAELNSKILKGLKK
jgi:hypothetical protein